MNQITWVRKLISFCVQQCMYDLLEQNNIHVEYNYCYSNSRIQCTKKIRRASGLDTRKRHQTCFSRHPHALLGDACTSFEVHAGPEEPGLGRALGVARAGAASSLRVRCGSRAKVYNCAPLRRHTCSSRPPRGHSRTLVRFSFKSEKLCLLRLYRIVHCL